MTKIEWQNPHVFFYIDVRDEQTGKVTNWALEMGAPAVIQRNGWTRNTMKIGDIVLVTGTKAKNGKPLANARSVVMASTGKKLGAGSSEGRHSVTRDRFAQASETGRNRTMRNRWLSGCADCWCAGAV